MNTQKTSKTVDHQMPAHEEAQTQLKPNTAAALHLNLTGNRGTAAMDPQTRKEVARKGGLAISKNRQHMSDIGRKGGLAVSQNREYMAQIGRKGGAASRSPSSG